MEIERGVVYRRSDERDTAWFAAALEALTTRMLPIPIVIEKPDAVIVKGGFEGFDPAQKAAKVGRGETELLVPCDEIQAFIVSAGEAFGRVP